MRYEEYQLNINQRFSACFIEAAEDIKTTRMIKEKKQINPILHEYY